MRRQSSTAAFVIDSCPAPVCRDVCAPRRHLYPDAQAGKKGDAYLGCCAAKEEWYFGPKAHVVVAENGRPVEVLLLCGCSSDLRGMKEMALNLPAGSVLYDDKAYNDYGYEQHLQEQQKLTLLPIRKRPHAEEIAAQIRRIRKRIETKFSQVQCAWLGALQRSPKQGLRAKSSQPLSLTPSWG